MRVLFGTNAYGRHMQHAALALHEAGALAAYCTGFVDRDGRAFGGPRRLVARLAPALDRELRRRRMPLVPEALVRPRWRWELPRTAAARLGCPSSLVDWLWERAERDLDRRCARLLGGPELDAFFGVEHGALASLRAARRLGKPSVLAFLSPHHATRRAWVDAEYERFPELATPASRRLLELGRRRDARRDEEARLADVILANSRFTRDSLAAAGIAPGRIVTVPLGSPPADSTRPPAPAGKGPARFVYAGPLSVRKGIHYVLEAWRILRPGAAAELHLYGAVTVPRRLLAGAGDGVVVHGSVAWDVLREGYRQGHALVFPTLCDGFGEVVTEALAHGLPVVTTPNAGAADLIEPGRNGFLVPVRDAAALAERMDWCIRHRGELEAMRGEARAAAEGWTWADFRARLRAELGRALGTPFTLGEVHDEHHAWTAHTSQGRVSP
jgi:glycosyltransferase involved in cell wall biosynthesis